MVIKDETVEVAPQQSEKPKQAVEQPASTFAGPSRVMSIDFFRGFTMFFLIGESTGIYNLLVDPRLNGSVISAIATQFLSLIHI